MCNNMNSVYVKHTKLYSHQPQTNSQYTRLKASETGGSMGKNAKPQHILSQAASHLEVPLQSTHARTPPNGPNRTLSAKPQLIATGGHSASMLHQGKEGKSWREGQREEQAGVCVGEVGCQQ